MFTVLEPTFVAGYCSTLDSQDPDSDLTLLVGRLVLDYEDTRD